MKSADETAIDYLSQAYLDLLRMPQGGVRARAQACLAEIRDALAVEMGDTPEGVQKFYEDWVRDPVAKQRAVIEKAKRAAREAAKQELVDQAQKLNMGYEVDKP